MSQGRLESLQTDFVATMDEISQLEDRNGGLANRSEWPDGQAERHENLTVHLARVEEDIKRMETRAAKVDAVRAAFESGVGLERTFGNQHVQRASGGNSTRDAAMRVLDNVVRAKSLPEHAAEKVERLMSDGPDAERSITARWAVATGADAYRSAFSKLCADPQNGHRLWDAKELAAFQEVEAVRTAMSTTAGNGGYMIPLTLDPAILLTNDGSINPLRRISRVVQTATNSWQGVSSAGATAEWKAEAAQAADGSPTIDDEPVPVHFGDVFVPYSFEVGMDAANFSNELAKVLVDAADQLQATAFTNGSGSGEPTGVIKALDGSSSEVAPTSAESLTSPDVFKVQNALPPRFQPRAQWCAALGTINTIRQYETTNGALKFPEVADGRLLGRALNENSNMDSTYNAAQTADNFLLLYGDFSNFVIVDRIGSQIELIPNLTGANGRPTGQRGAFLWFRTGSDVVVNNSFRVLNVATTA